VTTKRVDLENDITRAIAESFKANSLILSEFLLRNIAFSEEYSNAVEQKQIAEQQAQQAFFGVEQRKQEAEQARQAAQGQADAAVIAARVQQTRGCSRLRRRPAPINCSLSLCHLSCCNTSTYSRSPPASRPYSCPAATSSYCLCRM